MYLITADLSRGTEGHKGRERERRELHDRVRYQAFRNTSIFGTTELPNMNASTVTDITILLVIIHYTSLE